MVLLGFHGLRDRLDLAAVSIVGSAGVVAVLLAVLSIAEGFEQVMRATGSPEVVIVLGGGSDSEMTSNIPVADTRLIKQAPGLRTRDGVPIASAERFVAVDVPKKNVGTDAHVPLRGVEPAGFEVREGFRMLEGRRFRPGGDEVIVGVAAASQFENLTLGSVQVWGRSRWKVVGIFSTGGTAADSEIWTDLAVLQSRYRSEGTVQSICARLASPDSLALFREALDRDRRLNLKVARETDYYAEQAGMLTRTVRTLGGTLAVLMGLCATFGALNTMHACVAARRREIATLRALGFGPVPVVASVLGESLFLSLVGACIGGAAAWALFSGYETSTMNWRTFTQVAFTFRVTPQLIAIGASYALSIGLLGGLIPGVRAARLPVAMALREA